jgi:adenylate cyclase
MSHDIFISYSRKDSQQALAFVEQLTLQGLKVWIDQRGIEASASWSKEIVDAIDSCKVFAVLLSSASVASTNVIREISLALESGRSLLPIDIEEVNLPNEVRYQLTGIQRVPIGQFDRIMAGLTRLGLAAEGAPSSGHNIKKKDTRKSLLVLPFQDLSPGQDNLWFADGLAGELIDSLSVIKALRLIDRKTSSTLRTSTLPLFEIARTLDVRYVIEGSVRRFADQLKISISLLDVIEGEHLWQYAHKGVMDDIFQIQEEVADKVVEGLKVHLTSTEEDEIAKRGTTNVEAYTLYMRAQDFSRRQTRTSLHAAASLCRESLKHDPEYPPACALLASMLIREYKMYTEHDTLIKEAEEIVKAMMKRDPDSRFSLNVYSSLLFAKGDAEHAIEVGLRQLQLWPQYVFTYVTLAQAYTLAKRYAEADARYEQALSVDESYLSLYWNAMTVASYAGDLDRRAIWAKRGLKYFERHLKLNPDDEAIRIQYISLLEAAGRRDQAAIALKEIPTPIDAVSTYNLACLAGIIGENDRAIDLLKSCLSQENNLQEMIKTDPDFDKLRELPEFQQLVESR